MLVFYIDWFVHTNFWEIMAAPRTQTNFPTDLNWKARAVSFHGTLLWGWTMAAGKENLLKVS